MTFHIPGLMPMGLTDPPPSPSVDRLALPRMLMADNTVKQAITALGPPPGMFLVNVETDMLEQWVMDHWETVGAWSPGGTPDDPYAQAAWQGAAMLGNAGVAGVGGGAAGGGGVAPAPGPNPVTDPASPFLGVPDFLPSNTGGAGMTNAANVYNAGSDQATPGVPFVYQHIAAFVFPKDTHGNFLYYMGGMLVTAAGALLCRIGLFLDDVEFAGATVNQAGGKGLAFLAAITGDPFAVPTPTGTHDVKIKFTTLNANTVGIGGEFYQLTAIHY